MTASGGPESIGDGTATPPELGDTALDVWPDAPGAAVGVLVAGDPAAPPWHAATTSAVASTNPMAPELRLSLNICSTGVLR